jgi:hypothetical protein
VDGDPIVRLRSLYWTSLSLNSMLVSPAYRSILWNGGFSAFDNAGYEPTHIYLGALGSDQPRGMCTCPRQLRIPAIVKSKHGSNSVPLHALIGTAATHCFEHTNIANHGVTTMARANIPLRTLIQVALFEAETGDTLQGIQL